MVVVFVVVMVVDLVVMTMLGFKMRKQAVPMKSVVMTIMTIEAMMTMTMTSMTAMSALIKNILYIFKCKTFIFNLL